MHLLTSITKNYEGRAQPYADSLARHADFPCYVVGIDFTPGYKGVRCIQLDTAKNGGAAETSRSTQHGSFIHALPKGIRLDEVLLHTDADFLMQRPINDEERTFLDLPHDAVAVGYNGGPHETLLTEYHRLSANVPWQQMLMEWGYWLDEKNIFNVGCIAMTKKTWRKVYKFYMERWERICQHLSHPARQQWLVSYSLHALELDIRVMPWTLHAHGHFGLKPGMHRKGNEIWVGSQLALFKHYL